jgi:hypothetical protein
MAELSDLIQLLQARLASTVAAADARHRDQLAIADELTAKVNSLSEASRPEAGPSHRPAARPRPPRHPRSPPHAWADRWTFDPDEVSDSDGSDTPTRHPTSRRLRHRDLPVRTADTVLTSATLQPFDWLHVVANALVNAGVDVYDRRTPRVDITAAVRWALSMMDPSLARVIERMDVFNWPSLEAAVLSCFDSGSCDLTAEVELAAVKYDPAGAFSRFQLDFEMTRERLDHRLAPADRLSDKDLRKALLRALTPKLASDVVAQAPRGASSQTYMEIARRLHNGLLTCASLRDAGRAPTTGPPRANPPAQRAHVALGDAPPPTPPPPPPAAAGPSTAVPAGTNNVLAMFPAPVQSSAARTAYRDAGMCYFCGSTDHALLDCPAPGRAAYQATEKEKFDAREARRRG